MLKKKPGAKPNKKSLIAPAIDPTDESWGERHKAIMLFIITEARATVSALSQGPEAPSIETLFEAARNFVGILRLEVAALYGPGDNYNAVNNLATEADCYLRDDPLKTVCSFSAALMTLTRYLPVRR